MYTNGPYPDRTACERGLSDFKLFYMQMMAVATFSDCECSSARLVPKTSYDTPKPPPRSWRSSPLLGAAAAAITITTFVLTYRSKRNVVITPWINAESAGIGVTGGF
jgi:hypothetical protein